MRISGQLRGDSAGVRSRLFETPRIDDSDTSFLGMLRLHFSSVQTRLCPLGSAYFSTLVPNRKARSSPSRRRALARFRREQQEGPTIIDALRLHVQYRNVMKFGNSTPSTSFTMYTLPTLRTSEISREDVRIAMDEKLARGAPSLDPSVCARNPWSRRKRTLNPDALSAAASTDPSAPSEPVDSRYSAEAVLGTSRASFASRLGVLIYLDNMPGRAVLRGRSRRKLRAAAGIISF